MPDPPLVAFALKKEGPGAAGAGKAGSPVRHQRELATLQKENSDLRVALRKQVKFCSTQRCPFLSEVAILPDADGGG
jgi:hypothetical protein